MIDVALGGRAAEELIYGEDGTTSGCSSDLVNATNVATRMVRSFGYSDKIGLVAHGDDESRFLSDQTKDLIESEIKSCVLPTLLFLPMWMLTSDSWTSAWSASAAYSRRMRTSCTRSQKRWLSTRRSISTR